MRSAAMSFVVGVGVMMQMMNGYDGMLCAGFTLAKAAYWP